MSLDADSIVRLYTANAEELLRFFLRRVPEPEAAVDLMAETFASAFEQRHAFRGEAPAQELAWLYAIARSKLVDFARRGAVERRALSRLGFQRRALSDEEYDRVEQLAVSAALREEVIGALAGLAEEDRRALELRIVEERPYTSVASALGVSEQTARARVSRALAAMRRFPPLFATQGDD